jgi:hypothetical protein
MEHNKEYKDLIDQEKDILPAVSIDCVIFGFHENQLKVLLVKFGNTDIYSLSGGFVLNEESLDEAATRILNHRTGISNTYLEQFYVFGDPKRVDPEIHRTVMKKNGVDLPPTHFLFKRFISVGYYALVDFTQINPTSSIAQEESGWFDIYELPANIAFDHLHIIQKALESLRLLLDHKLAVFNLMPETFTMGELQSLYETILNKKLLRANFQRKMLSLGILERLEKKWGGGAHKAPYLYRFDQSKAIPAHNPDYWE